MTTPVLLSIIALVISVLGSVATISYWKGKYDNDLNWIKKALQTYAEAKVIERIIKIETKFDVVWSAFTEQVLTDRTHLATRSSPLKLTAHAKQAAEEVKSCLKQISNNTTISDRVLLDIPHQLGMVKLRQIADNHNMTIGELLATISLDLHPNEEDCGKTSPAD